MPYKTIKDLPTGVRDNLPSKALEIYKEAFNAACDQYKDQEDTEKIAHKVAWSAVKQKYEKHSDTWHRKD